MYGVPPEGTATKVHEQGEIVLNCNVGMYMLNVIGGGGGCGGEEKGLSCKRGWYDKLEGERVIPVKMWEGGEEVSWGCSYTRYPKQNKLMGKCCEWESKYQW